MVLGHKKRTMSLTMGKMDKKLTPFFHGYVKLQTGHQKERDE
jgi:hypothetical protein